MFSYQLMFGDRPGYPKAICKWFAYSFQQLELLNVFTCDVWVSENGTKPTLVINAVL
jgi:hypothetical protein